MFEPESGATVIYRYRDYDKSDCVRVLRRDNSKKSPRYDVQFLTGANSTNVENVPGRRLRGYWHDVEAYDTLMANWERIDNYTLTEIEKHAIETVFSLLIPKDVADWHWSPVRFALQISESDGLKPIIGMEIPDLLAQAEHFEMGTEIRGSPELTLLVAEYGCRVAPSVVLEWVANDEAEYAEACKRGKASTDTDGNPDRTSPEWEHRMYLEYGRPHHELLRSWCGHRAASMQDRLNALEHQNRELDELVISLLKELKRLDTSKLTLLSYSQHYATTKKLKSRPQIDRPLEPHEIPVRYITGPRRWGY